MNIKIIKKPQVYRVKNETLDELAKKFEVSVLAIKQLNQISSVSKGDIIAVPQENFYIVKPADTLDKIANKLSINKQELMRKNNIQKVFIGQILFY
jgi:LysM repeat protein